MVMGFAVLIALCTVVGVIAILQVNSLTGSMNEVANHDMLSMDNLDEGKFHVSEVVLLLHRYQDGETEGVVSNFTADYLEGREHFVDLKALHPDLGSNIDVIIGLLDEINILSTDPSMGIFFLMDSYWSVEGDVDNAEGDVQPQIATLIAAQNDSSALANATLLSYYVAQQTLESMEYFDAVDDAERTDRINAFNSLGDDFRAACLNIRNNPLGMNPVNILG
ncbi:hypothetical protein LCGC14_1480990, partial [marine sediment metagenome]